MIYFVPEAAEAYARLGITGTGRIFRVAGGANGRGAGGRRRLDLLQLQSRIWCRPPSRRAWESASPASWWRRVSRRWTRPSTGSRATTCCARKRWSAPPPGPDGGRGGVPPRRGPAAGGGARRRAMADRAHLVLWHAQSILREYRGDGHIALLVVHGLSGIEALVTHAAAGDVPAQVLQSTRGWSDEAWRAAPTPCASRAGSRGASRFASPSGAPRSARR